MPADPRDTIGHDQAQADKEADRGDRLMGWKAIAAYLGRDIRTVQRYEMLEHLPVHRLEHQRQGSTYAFRSELDEWQKRRSTDRVVGEPDEHAPALPGRRLWPWGLAAGLLATLLVVGFAMYGRQGGRIGGEGGDTKNAQAYAAYAEGKALYAARQYKAAVTSLERAVSRDSNFGAAWALLAKTHARLAQPVWAGGQAASSRAAESARHAAALAPDSPDTRIALALAARARGDLATWRNEAQRAVDLDARAAEAYALLGDSYASVVYACNRDQDPERAEAYYRKALELAPDLTTAISNRAGNLRRMGRYTECIELLDKASRTFRDEAPLRATRGACRLMQGDLKGASEDIEALRGNPKIAPAGALVYFGLLDLKKGNTEQGVKELEDAVQASPSSRSDLIVAEVYATAGDITRATMHMKRAFGADPGCAGMVDTSLAFRSVRNTPEVRQLLESYGIR
jgi:tetratricopeptide (TPR) repeat protein